MSIYEKFENIVNNPFTYIQNLKKEKNVPVLSFMCTYTPEEIIHAAGIHPFRMFGATDQIEKSDAHLQAYSCSLVRSVLEDALTGKLNFIDGAVFPHTCDSIQRLSDIWRINTNFSHHFDVVLPVKLNTINSKQYMIDVLYKFKNDIGDSFGIKITDENLYKTIDIFNEMKTNLKKLWQLNSKGKIKLKGSQLLNIIKASMIMDKSEFNNDLNILFDEIKTSEQSNFKRIMLIGGICNHPDIYGYIENAGAKVVWDDMCTGTRYFEGLIEKDDDPIKAIALRYYNRNLCPAKHRQVDTRGKNLVNILKEHNIDGAIFLYLKFCDPHSFDYPYLKEILDNNNIPSILLEIEQQLPAEGQIKTRIEAFVEMLK